MPVIILGPMVLHPELFQVLLGVDCRMITESRPRYILCNFGGTQKGGFQKGGFGGCSPGTKTGTRVRSDVPPERKTGTRVRSHVPPERRPEQGHIRQNHPFTKPPFYLPVIIGGCKDHRRFHFDLMSSAEFGTPKKIIFPRVC